MTNFVRISIVLTSMIIVTAVPNIPVLNATLKQQQGNPQLDIFTTNLSFQTEDSTNSLGENAKTNQNKIPASFLAQLNNISSSDEFLRKFTSVYQEPRIKNDLHPIALPYTSNTRSRSQDYALPKPAHCEPQLVPVPFEKPKDPSEMIFPFCTKIERCGGCCSDDMFQCEPTNTEMLLFQVYRGKYLGLEGRFGEDEFLDMQLERHLECECRCRVKEDHCKPERQVYLPKECRCKCINEEEAGQCVGQNKEWDNEKCECACSNYRTCTTGSIFQTETCSCVALRNQSRRFANDSSISTNTRRNNRNNSNNNNNNGRNRRYAELIDSWSSPVSGATLKQRSIIIINETYN